MKQMISGIWNFCRGLLKGVGNPILYILLFIIGGAILLGIIGLIIAIFLAINIGIYVGIFALIGVIANWICGELLLNLFGKIGLNYAVWQVFAIIGFIVWFLRVLFITLFKRG